MTSNPTTTDIKALEQELAHSELGYSEGMNDPKGFNRTMFKIRHVVGTALKWAVIGAVVGGLGIGLAGGWAAVSMTIATMQATGGIVGAIGALTVAVVGALGAISAPVSGVLAAVGLGVAAAGTTTAVGTGAALYIGSMALSAVSAVLLTGAVIGGGIGALLGVTTSAGSASDAADDRADEIRAEKDNFIAKQQKLEAVRIQRQKQMMEMTKQARALGITMDPKMSLAGLPMGHAAGMVR